MKSKIDLILIINILLVIIISIEYIFFLIFEEFSLKILEFQLMLVFVYSIFSIYYLTKNWLNIYIMFLSIIFLFLLTRPLMHLLDIGSMINYNEYEWFKIREDFKFSDFTMNKINFILIYMLLFLNIGYLTGLRYFFKPIVNILALKMQTSKYLNIKFGYIFFFIGLVAFLIKVFLYAKILHKYGYFYLYSGNYTLPFIIRVLGNFFYIGYVIIMVNIPNKKKAYLISLIFLIFYATILFTGMRGKFFIVALSVLYILSILYNWRPKLWQNLIIGVILIILAQLTMAIKFSYISFKDFNLFNIINKFLYNQGVTILVLGYFVEFSNHFVNLYSGIRYIISPFVSLFYTLTGQYGSRLEMKPTDIYSVGDMLQYFTDPNGYYMGAGTGSSFVVELYGLGGDIIFVAFGCFLLAFIIAYLSERFIYKKYGFFIFLIILPTLFWIPRGSLLLPFQKFIFAIVLLVTFIFLYELIKVKKIFYEKGK